MSVQFFAADRIADPLADDLMLDVCDANARQILVALGLLGIGGAEDVELVDAPAPEDLAELYGEAKAEDFLGRVLLAEALDPGDPGRPAIEEDRFFDFGRRPGYLAEKLQVLERLAQYCLEVGADVVWA